MEAGPENPRPAIFLIGHPVEVGVRLEVFKVIEDQRLVKIFLVAELV